MEQIVNISLALHSDKTVKLENHVTFQSIDSVQVLHRCEDNHDRVYKICCSLLRDLDNLGVIAHVFTKSKLSLDESKLLCNVYTDQIEFYLMDEDDNRVELDEELYLTVQATLL